ncbi:hypothetical protein Tco_0860960 [Tanacetum coccineum]|uniref:Integrase, catalytic region, zinc finger, CCHC-type, peptidase aspartic, catalytic n=1 Tax=Tanacetum coccineum TaxID=301880 RepID=A0ABQ5BJG9_9ASTR
MKSRNRVTAYAVRITWLIADIEDKYHGPRLHKDGDADASFHFRNSDKYYHDPEECEYAGPKVAFCLLEDLTAFCFKTSLRFASRPHCVLLQEFIAFCFKLSLRFASTSLRFAQDLHCGKENGLQILQSINQGPFELGTTRDALGTTPEGGVLLGPERSHTYEDLSDTEKKRYDANFRATNIVLQGLPKDIYKLINHKIEAKAIWDNIKMLLAGSELTKEDRES